MVILVIIIILIKKNLQLFNVSNFLRVNLLD